MDDSLQTDIDTCLRADRHRLRNRLRRLNQPARRGKTVATVKDSVDAVKKDIEVSRAKRSSRLDGLPKPEYPTDLPIVQHREAIVDSIRCNTVTIVCGETGSGKTTQIPKMCLEAGLGVDGLIGHTQPRRIAARSVSNRIAAELKSELGRTVGYKVRFQDKVAPDSYIKLMTDGILLAELQSDPWLNQYDVIIVDEAHERSLNIDFILGYLKRLLNKRRDLKIVITSATIDPDSF